MRIRQVALVAKDLEPALEAITDVFGIEIACRDVGVSVFGLVNGVMPVGDTFLEVVSPTRADASASRYLDKRGGDGGYMVIFQTRDLAAERTRLQSLGVRVAWEIAFPDIATLHLHPRDTGGAIVSVDEARPFEAWRWAGPDWQRSRRTERVSGIAGVEIQGDAPQALASRWAEIFGLTRCDDPCRLTLEDGAEIRFVQATDGRGEGIRSITLTATDPGAVLTAARRRGLAIDGDATVVVAGVRFVLG